MINHFRSWITGRMVDHSNIHAVEDLTLLLKRWREPFARERMFSLIYPELRRIAGIRMRNERFDHTLQPTALVNEVFLVLVRQEGANWQDRAHFMSIASTAMRRILVDYARVHNAGKRPPAHARVPLDSANFTVGDNFAQLVEIDQLLDQLAHKDARLAQVVELRYFGGLSFEEVAEVLNVNQRTVKRDWRIARGWLFATLLPEDSSLESPT